MKFKSMLIILAITMLSLVPFISAGVKVHTDGRIIAEGVIDIDESSEETSSFVWNPKNSSLAIGLDTKANSFFSTAIGSGTTASGYASTAIGSGTTASGYVSTAIGSGTTASESWSTSMGDSTTASGLASTAMGSGTTASGYASTAMGMGTTASGLYSTSIGVGTSAQSHSSLVIGRYNIISGNSLNWVPTDPLFVIGNGASTSAPSNALTVLKNGKTGIKTANPAVELSVNGTIQAIPQSAAITCNAATEGSIYYNRISKHFFGCDGATWKQLD